MTMLVREGLTRSVPFLVRESDDSADGDGLTLSGHAAVFNQETEINSWEGNFLETISPGAFRKTIRERTPVLQFDHGRHPLVGSIPIGAINSLREDDEGLYVEARMADNWLMEPVRDAIKNRSINGMSFRFEVIRELWEDKDGKKVSDPEELWRLLWNPGDRGPLKRTLKELKVHELGPVVFPAYEGTSVDLRAKQIAESVYENREFVRNIRQDLALDNPKSVYFPANADLRPDIAKAILFRDVIQEDDSSNKVTINVTSNPNAADVADAIRSYEQRNNGVSAPSTTDVEDTRTKDPDNSVDAPLSEHPSKASAELRNRIKYGIRAMNRRIDSASEELLND